MPLLVVDSHVVMREGVCSLIDQQPDFVVVAQAADVDQACSVDVTPEVIITEVDLPDARYADVIARLRGRFGSTPILALTSVAHPAMVQVVLGAGADGYLLKTASSADLFTALRALVRGGSYLQPSVGMEVARWNRPRDTVVALSAQEDSVLCLLALGHTNAEVARLRGVSLRTVETQRSRIHQKLGRRTRAELVQYAHEVGLLERDAR